MFCYPFIDFFSDHFGVIDGTTDYYGTYNGIIGTFFLGWNGKQEKVMEEKEEGEEKEKEEEEGGGSM